ncbi:MAG: hypothetical protein QXJ68_03825 [Methanocellales archaeon]
MRIASYLRKLSKWRVLAILLIAFLILFIAARILYIESHRISLTQEQRERAENAARLAFEGKLTPDFKSYIQNSGWYFDTPSGIKKIVYVSFNTNNSSLGALVDLDTYEVVRISEVYYKGWMEEYNRLRPEYWVHQKFLR